MGETITARIPPHVEQKLAEHCANRGITRTEAIVRALDDYLDKDTGGASPYSLAVDLIPRKGVNEIQSGNVRGRKRFKILLGVGCAFPGEPPENGV